MTDAFPITLLEMPVIRQRPGYLPQAIVLRDFGPGEAQRYVTHRRVTNGPGAVEVIPGGLAHKYSYEGGGYYSDLRKAYECWCERAASAARTSLADIMEPAPELPPTVVVPLEIAQAVYGLLDEGAHSLNEADFDADMVTGAVQGLEAILKADHSAGYSEVQAALTKVGDTAKAKRLEAEAAQAADVKASGGYARL